MFAILYGLFPKKGGYRVFHVDWSNYTSSMGKGLDIKLFQRNKLLAVFEVKNWAKKGRPYGTETATIHRAPEPKKPSLIQRMIKAVIGA